ncbi:MAG: sigma-70 family RNA polymerase sigma factor [Planctomycetota bacterium]|nr:sigma-70 family RNA polymerase sigma factor [Planctomycetota bacterium]
MEPNGASHAAPITSLLQRAGAGDSRASEELMPLVYEELRKLARGRVVKMAAGQTIQATDLVHEAWMRLIAGGDPGFESRAHFFGAAANAMRNILVEQARKKATLKRDGTRKKELQTDLPEILPGAPVDDVLALHDALEKLEEAHERPARIVELRFFAGLSMPEAAEIVGISLATAERDWRFARSWLQHEMEEGSGP